MVDKVVVYQEIVLAKSASLICGPDTLDWDELSYGTDIWNRLRNPSQEATAHLTSI
jgi:hypothetical protein